MPHALSYSLRTMQGLVDRKVLDAAAAELDRLHTLIVDLTTNSSASYSAHRRQVALLETRIKELEHAMGTTRIPNG